MGWRGLQSSGHPNLPASCPPKACKGCGIVQHRAGSPWPSPHTLAEGSSHRSHECCLQPAVAAVSTAGDAAFQVGLRQWLLAESSGQLWPGSLAWCCYSHCHGQAGPRPGGQVLGAAMLSASSACISCPCPTSLPCSLQLPATICSPGAFSQVCSYGGSVGLAPGVPGPADFHPVKQPPFHCCCVHNTRINGGHVAGGPLALGRVPSTTAMLSPVPALRRMSRFAQGWVGCKGGPLQS